MPSHPRRPAPRCAATQATRCLRATLRLDLLRRRQGGRLLHRYVHHRLLAPVPRDRAAAPRRSYRATRARLPGAASPSGRCSIGIAKVRRRRPRLPVLSTYLGHACIPRHLLVSLGLPRVDRGGHSSIGDGRRRHEARLQCRHVDRAVPHRAAHAPVTSAPTRSHPTGIRSGCCSRSHRRGSASSLRIWHSATWMHRSSVHFVHRS